MESVFDEVFVLMESFGDLTRKVSVDTFFRFEHIENLKAGNTGPETCEILIKGTFDPRYHFPQKYLRFEIGGMNQTPDVSWEVSRFEPL